MKRKMKILINYDGSDQAAASLRNMRRAGLPDDAEAIVISIADSSLPWKSRNRNNGRAEAGVIYPTVAVEQAAAKAKLARDIIGEEFPDWNVRINLAVGSTVRVIAKKAAEWNADLIVVGLHADSTIEKSLFDSISQRIAARVNCSIRVERPSRTKAEVEVNSEAEPRILLCVDESPNAQIVVQAVAARIWPKRAEARLLTVVNPFDYSIVPLLDEKIKRTKLMHRALANELEYTPLFVSSEVKEGEPAEVILKEAQDWRATTIFVGTTGKSRVHRFLAGGVSATVAAQAHCPVELIRLGGLWSGLTKSMQTPDALLNLPLSKKSV